MSKNTEKELMKASVSPELLVRYDKIRDGQLKAVYPNQPEYENAQYGFALIKHSKGIKFT